VKHSAKAPSTFGERLRWIREKYALTLDDFGNQIGVGRSYLSKLENGKRCKTSEQFIYALTHAFEVRRDWLLHGEGSPFTSDSLNATAAKGPLQLPHDPSEDKLRNIFANALLAAGLMFRVKPSILTLARGLRKETDTGGYNPLQVQTSKIFLHEIEAQLERLAKSGCSELAQPIEEILSDLGKLADMAAKVDDEIAAREKVPVLIPTESVPKTLSLTIRNVSVTNTDVKAQWPILKKRLQAATANRGGKSKLAKFLGVQVQAVSQWLTDHKESEREPGAETALRMLNWVEQQERK
jgi:transcriptional regulator with XRE-family HTH domain